uniref:Uncharacterized protein n=1 Tax=Oryza punctata TaxID=4537 RepID=A0A0E0JM45_ORYPU
MPMRLQSVRTTTTSTASISGRQLEIGRDRSQQASRWRVLSPPLGPHVPARRQPWRGQRGAGTDTCRSAATERSEGACVPEPRTTATASVGERRWWW